MSFLPEWAPNVHPMIVHFPIGLLFAAVLVDVVGLVLRTQTFWRKASLMLYVMGAIAALTAFLTGQSAGDSVFLPTDANAVLTDHADLALYTLWFFGVFAVVRGIFFAMSLDTRTLFRVPLVLVGLGGLFLVYETAEHGSEMVFRYGVGVQAVDQSPDLAISRSDSLAMFGPVRMETGGWTWKPTRAAAWVRDMQILEGEGAFISSMRDGGEHGDVLGLTTSGEPVMIVFDEPMTTLQLDAALNVDEFEGTVMFVHHVKDAANYHFSAISKADMRQGHSENGDLYLADEAEQALPAWHTYRVVADMTHFRAYADETLITHGHGDDAGSGTVGIRLNGTGTVLLDYIQVVPLR